MNKDEIRALAVPTEAPIEVRGTLPSGLPFHTISGKNQAAIRIGDRVGVPQRWLSLDDAYALGLALLTMTGGSDAD